MGLMLTTTERMHELENQVESYSIGIAKMEKEHETLLRQYRELRDNKNGEIAKLHEVIEDLKAQRAEDRKTIKMLRGCVAYYEARKKC